MPGWLQKISATAKKQNLPVILRGGAVGPAQTPAGPQKLPNASVIYGVAASFLAVVGIYFLFTGGWFTGVLVLFLAACFLGFALHFIKHAP